MRWQSIHEQNEMLATLVTLELFEEFDEMTRSDRFLLHREHQSRTGSVWTTDDRAKNSTMFPSSR